MIADDFPESAPKPMGDWVERANCLGLPTAMFFPERGVNAAPARDVCSRCVVRQECLDYALTPPMESFGIWGGVGRDKRQQMFKERSA